MRQATDNGTIVLALPLIAIGAAGFYGLAGLIRLARRGRR